MCFKSVVEEYTGLLNQFCLAFDLLEEQLLEWFPAVSPEVIAAVPPGCGQGHNIHCALGVQPEMVQSVLLQGVRVLPLAMLER